MPTPLNIVVCAGISPDPLQTLEPTTTPTGPGLKNELVLPAVLDPWAASALYEAAALAEKNPGSKLCLVSLGPKAKLQQVMMTVAQKVPFELVPIDGPIGGFPDAHSTAAAIAETIAAIPSLDRSKLFIFGGWESATRGAGVTLHIVGELLGITDQFQGVDQITLRDDGSFEVLERIEGGRHQVSVCAGPPAVLGWATGNLAEPRNNPQVGMANMRTIMPALQKAKARNARSQRPPLRLRQPSQTAAHHPRRQRPNPRPDRRRTSRVDRSQIMESILVLTHADETTPHSPKPHSKPLPPASTSPPASARPSPSASSPQTQPTSP